MALKLVGVGLVLACVLAGCANVIIGFDPCLPGASPPAPGAYPFEAGNGSRVLPIRVQDALHHAPIAGARMQILWNRDPVPDGYTSSSFPPEAALRHLELMADSKGNAIAHVDPERYMQVAAIAPGYLEDWTIWRRDDAARGLVVELTPEVGTLTANGTLPAPWLSDTRGDVWLSHPFSLGANYTRGHVGVSKVLVVVDWVAPLSGYAALYPRIGPSADNDTGGESEGGGHLIGHQSRNFTYYPGGVFPLHWLDGNTFYAGPKTGSTTTLQPVPYDVTVTVDFWSRTQTSTCQHQLQDNQRV